MTDTAYATMVWPPEEWEPWPNIEGRWHVEAFHGNEPRKRFLNIPDGATAIETARRWHRTGLRVYVWTPDGYVYLTQDNGYTRVGF